MRTVIAIVVAAIVLFFLFAIFKATIGLPETQQRLKAAPYITDNEVHPEYNGELIIVQGAITAGGDAYDDDLMVTLPSPFAVRYVDILKASHDEDGHACLKWTPVRRNDESEWLHERTLCDNLQIGGYVLDESLSSMLTAGKDISYSMYDADELKNLADHNISVIESAGTVYLSEVPKAYFSSPCYNFAYEGFRRVHYRIMVPDTQRDCAVAGVAVGGRLRRDETLDTRPIFEDAKSHGDVVGQNLLYTILGMVIVLVICLLLLFYIGRMFF